MEVADVSDNDFDTIQFFQEVPVELMFKWIY